MLLTVIQWEGRRETPEENKWKQNFHGNFGDLQRTLKWIMDIQGATTEKILKMEWIITGPIAN